MCGTCNGCAGCSGKRRASPDSMRHGGFPAEVRGSDHAAAVQRGRAMYKPVAFTNAEINQSEFGEPRTSRDGVAMHRNLSRTIRQMNPIPYLQRFNGNIGVTLVQNARNIPLIYNGGYDGIVPITMQPKLTKPLPY